MDDPTKNDANPIAATALDHADTNKRRWRRRKLLLRFGCLAVLIVLLAQSVIAWTISKWPAPQEKFSTEVAGDEDHYSRIHQAWMNYNFNPSQEIEPSPEEVVELYLRQMAKEPGAPATYAALRDFYQFYEDYRYPEARWINALKKRKNHGNPLVKNAARLLLSRIYSGMGYPRKWVDLFGDYEHDGDWHPSYSAAAIQKFVTCPIWSKVSDYYWSSVIHDSQAEPLLGPAYWFRLWQDDSLPQTATFNRILLEDSFFAYIYRNKVLTEKRSQLARESMHNMESVQYRMLIDDSYELNISKLKEIDAYLENPWPIYELGRIYTDLSADQRSEVLQEVDRLEYPDYLLPYKDGSFGRAQPTTSEARGSL